MKRFFAAALIGLTMAACSMLPKVGDGVPSSSEQRKKLTQAVELVRQGNSTGAGKILAKICREKAVPGVTDEALFRLSLLTLRSGTDKETASQYLERLQNEFPTSAWTKTAAPLADLLTQYEETRSQIRNLKATNQSLGRENKELLQNIQRLKNLDLELDRKMRPGK